MNVGAASVGHAILRAGSSQRTPVAASGSYGRTSGTRPRSRREGEEAVRDPGGIQRRSVLGGQIHAVIANRRWVTPGAGRPPRRRSRRGCSGRAWSPRAAPPARGDRGASRVQVPRSAALFRRAGSMPCSGNSCAQNDAREGTALVLEATVRSTRTPGSAVASNSIRRPRRRAPRRRSGRSISGSRSSAPRSRREVPGQIRR